MNVQGPNGAVISFPDGTDPTTIDQVMRQNFGGGQVLTDDGDTSWLNGQSTQPTHEPGLIERVGSAIAHPIQTVQDAWNYPGSYVADAAKGMASSVKDAATLPGDVATGKVDMNDPAQAKANAARVLSAAMLTTPGDMMAPGLTGKVVQNVTMPARGELKAAESGAYKAAEDTGTAYSPGSVAGMLRNATTQPGFPDPAAAPLTFGLVKDLANVSAPGGIQDIIPVNRLETLRQDLGGINEGRDAHAAGRVKSALDDFLENPPEGAAVSGDADAVAGLYGTARANSAARIRADQLAQALQGGERRSATANSGNNEANSIRQRVRSFVDQNNQLTGYGENDYRIPGYTDDQNTAIKTVLAGTPVQNAARSTGNFFGKGGGLGRLAATAVSAGALSHVMGPEVGGTLGAMLPTVIGGTARGIDDAYARQGVKGLIDSMIQRSPLYQERAANTPFELPTNASGTALVRALMAQQGQQPQP